MRGWVSTERTASARLWVAGTCASRPGSHRPAGAVYHELPLASMQEGSVMYDLPPPPRNSTVVRQNAAPNRARRSDPALQDPNDVLRTFTRHSGAPDPVAHRNIPIAPFVIGFTVFAFIAGFFGFGGGALFHTTSPSPLVRTPSPADQTSTPPTPQVTAPPSATGQIILPAMDDASMQATNGTLIHLDPQSAELLYRWGGVTGALCQVRLGDGREPWVPCWRLNMPDATPAPTPLPLPTNPPAPLPPSNTPAPPCASASGQNGQFTQCGWEPGLRSTVEALAGPELEIAPPPTMCASSGAVTVCDVTGPATLQNQADSFNKQTADAAPAPPAQTIR